MNTTEARKQLTTIGTAVEVEVIDFSPEGFAAGFPRIWVKGTVVRVEGMTNPKHTSIDVLTELGTHAPQVIGPRGGNRQIRLAA